MSSAVRHIASLVALLALVVPSGWADARPETDLAHRSFTVVAVVDTGINPYHADFRRPEFAQHPATYIEGFPRSARRLDLSLSAPNYDVALGKDHSIWQGIKGDRLHWIPGTNIIGAIGPFGSPETFLDEEGHGTAVASLAAGALHGPGSDDILLVVVEGWLEGLKWAARQPWIDVITNSWGVLSNDFSGVAAGSREAVENGKVVCFASGNAYAPLWWWGTQGPSWNVNVGAASEKTRGEHTYSGYPNDVLGLSNTLAATYDSIDDEKIFGGTSAATPNVCGQIAAVLAQVRGALGDRSEGSEAGLASGPDMRGPYLRDGCLDALELEDAVQATADPAEAAPPSPDDPDAVPALPVAGFVRGGYGIVDRASAAAARDVLLGQAPRPDRMMEEGWVDFTDSIRDEIYGRRPAPATC